MSLFTPITGIIGGTLIGSSAGVLLLMNGDIMGVSGIMNNTFSLKSMKDPTNHWRWVWLGSFALTVNLYINFLSPSKALADERSQAEDVPIPSHLAHLLGGFLVGVGSKLQNGCTTGHGICGISRYSRRSLVAVCSFTGCSILTRYIVAPTRPWANLTNILRMPTLPAASPVASSLAMLAVVFPAMARPTTDCSEVDSAKSLGAALSGILFALGLAVSGMTKNSKVHDFLCFSNIAKAAHDPTLMAVMASGIISSWLSYQFIKGYGKLGNVECPLNLPKGSEFSVPTNKTIDSRLLAGAASFGMGWGISGICPGPALYGAFAGVLDCSLLWIPGFVAGAFVGQKMVDKIWEKKKDD